MLVIARGRILAIQAVRVSLPLQLSFNSTCQPRGLGVRRLGAEERDRVGRKAEHGL